MIEVNDIVSYINTILPVESEQKPQKSGLQIEGKECVRSVASCTSLTIDVIEKAIKQGADSLLTNCASIYDNEQGPITGEKYQCLKTLLDYEISLLVYPTPVTDHSMINTENESNKEQDCGIKMLGSRLQDKFAINHYFLG